MPDAVSRPMSFPKGAALRRDPRRDIRWLALLFAGSAVAFVLAPGLDAAVSGWFYRPGTGFAIAGSPLAERVRMGLWTLSNATFGLALAALLLGLGLRRPVLGQGAWRWGYIVALYLTGPVLLVNRILKEHWGRARPADVTQFGGAHDFSPFWQPSDQCLSNCSFVSGEVSGTTATAIALMVIAPGLGRWIGDRGVLALRLVAFCLPWIVAAQRIAAGRHFLSDTVFSALLTLLVALLLSPLLRREGAPGGQGPRA